MTEENATPSPGAANRRWRRLTPLLLVLVGFGAGVLASHLAPARRMHRGESGRSRSEASEGRSRRGGGTGDRDRSPRSDARSDARSGEERSRRFREQLVRHLELSEDQQAQINAFIEVNRTEARAFWDETHARYRELRLRFREQIREILTESQRETFDSWNERRERNDRGAASANNSPEGARR